jgi:hypothetical protein
VPAQEQVFPEEQVLSETVRLNGAREVCAQHAPRFCPFTPGFRFLDAHSVDGQKGRVS